MVITAIAGTAGVGKAARGYDEIGHPRGEQIRAKLGSLGRMPPPLSLAGAEL